MVQEKEIEKCRKHTKTSDKWNQEENHSKNKRIEVRAMDTKQKILALMDEVLQVPEGTVTEETTMEDLEQWDSLAHVMLIGELESRLGISIPLEEAIEITTAREILEKAGV